MAGGKIRIFYILSFLGGLSFNIIAPLFIVYALSVGLSIAQAGLLLGVNRLSVLVFEIPTGIFADSRGRKRSILLAYLLTVISALLYYANWNYYLLIIASILNGLALAFISGAFEALLVDAGELQNKENLRNKILVRMGIISTIGFISGGLLGSIAAHFNLSYIWLFHSAVIIVGLILGSLLLNESSFVENSVSRKITWQSFVEKIKNIKTLLISKKKIVKLIAIAAIMSLASALYIISWPLIFKDILRIPVEYFGVISGIAGVFSLVGSISAGKMSEKKGTAKTLVLTLLAASLAYATFAISRSVIISLACFMLIDFFTGGFNPIFYSFFNKFIPSEKRASLLSLFSFAEEGAGGLAEISAGSLLLIVTVPLVALFAPLFVLLALAIFFKEEVIQKGRKTA